MTTDTQPVELFTADYTPVTVTPGVLDDAVTRAYMEGNCLPMAIALAQDMTPLGSVILVNIDNGANLVHAFAEDSDGNLWDVRGRHDAEQAFTALDEKHGQSVTVDILSHFAATLMLGPDALDEVGLAATFSPLVLEKQA